MSKDKLERILATYPPVEGRPGYVWVNKAENTIIELKLLREQYEEAFNQGAHEIKEE